MLSRVGRSSYLQMISTLARTAMHWLHLHLAQKCMLIASPRDNIPISAMILPIFNTDIFCDSHLKANLQI